MKGPGSTSAAASVLPAALASGALIAQHVAGKATRDTLFLDQFGVQLLPAAMIGAALVSSIALVAISRALARWGPARVVPVMFALGAVLFLLEWWLSVHSIHAASIAVYAHMAIFGSAGVSAFWSLVNERFDPMTAKKVVGKIASGGTLGGVLGGVLVWRASAHLSVPMMLALLAGINVIGLWGALRTVPRAPRAAKQDEPFEGGGLRALKETPYLRDLALLVAAGAVIQALLDWLLSAHATQRFGRGQDLLAFFALFNMIVGVASFAAQTVLARPVLEKRGLAGTVKLQPMGVIAGAVVALVAPHLQAVVLLRWTEATGRSSLYRSAYELFYTPLPKAKKRAAKTLVDVGFDRIGTTVGSVALLAIAPLALEVSSRIVLFAAIGTAIVAWLLSARLHDGYVATLASSLKSGSVALDADGAFDLTTRKTLAETTALLDRDKLLASIDQLQRAKGAGGAAGAGAGRAGGAEAAKAPARPASREARPPSSDQPPAPASDPLLARVAALRSGEPARVRAELAAPLAPSLAPFVVPLLANDAVVRDAVRALRKIAPRVSGHLVDVLLDHESDPRVRRRIPRVLKVVRTPRSAAGLLAALEDPVFDVRVQVALALAQMKDESDVALPHEPVFELVERELTAGRATWGPPHASPGVASEDADDAEAREGARDAPAGEGDAAHAAHAGKVGHAGQADLHRGLAHVFTVLGLVLDREPLAIAYRALRAEDPVLRGTAFEYLDVVLPPKLRDVIVPLLGDVRIDVKPARAGDKGREKKELADELLRSTHAGSARTDPAGPRTR